MTIEYYNCDREQWWSLNCETVYGYRDEEVGGHGAECKLLNVTLFLLLWGEGTFMWCQWCHQYASNRWNVRACSSTVTNGAEKECPLAVAVWLLLWCSWDNIRYCTVQLRIHRKFHPLKVHWWIFRPEPYPNNPKSKFQTESASRMHLPLRTNKWFNDGPKISKRKKNVIPKN